MVSNDDILALLEKRKDIFPTEQMKLIKENIDVLSDETKEKIYQTASHADKVIGAVETFESEVKRLKEEDDAAIEEFRAKTKVFEKSQHEKEEQEVESMLKNL